MSLTVEIPNEIILHIFAYLPLKALIAARGVCREWRIFSELAEIPVARRQLLNLYLRIVNSPNFLRTRPWTIENLKSFDRQAFVNTLLEQHNFLPESFLMWLLEWPARAAIACSWPGLPRKFCSYQADGIEQIMGVNWLAALPPSPQVCAIQYIPQDGESERAYIPALMIWRNSSTTVWLSLDLRQELCGKVYTLTSGGPVIEDPELGSIEYDQCDKDWIAYLVMLWERIEQNVEILANLPSESEDLDLNRLCALPDDYMAKSIPEYSPPWVRRNEPIFQHRLYHGWDTVHDSITVV